jgi:hypothetical protein
MITGGLRGCLLIEAQGGVTLLQNACAPEVSEGFGQEVLVVVFGNKEAVSSEM